MRKKIIAVLLMAFVLCLTGCGSDPSKEMVTEPTIEQSSQIVKDNTDESKEDESTDPSKQEMLDLTELSSTMVYSEVFNMMNSPQNYVGRKIRMQGVFAVYEDTVNNKNYYACIIQDATACCQQGVEFVLTDSGTYPDDYPEIGGTLTVEGVFDTYEENGMKYCQLIGATMTY